MNELVNTYYRENYNALVKKVKNRAGSPENAEDVVQEAFTRALKYFDSYLPHLKFEKWFGVILSNTLKDYQNDSRMAGLTKNIDDAIDELEPIIPNHIKDHFRNHMDKLSAHKASYNKEIIRLNILFGYSPKEISELLGLAQSTVRNSLSTFTKEVMEIYG